MFRRLAVALLLLVAACHGAGSPELRVLGVHDQLRHEVVFVEVTNPANRPMRLTKLEYTFAAAGETLSEGEVSLERDVPANSAVVVEVPLDSASTQAMTLQGKLTAELDEIVRIFKVSAEIQPKAL
jgi:LEA14-like dessication related protein